MVDPSFRQHRRGHPPGLRNLIFCQPKAKTRVGVIRQESLGERLFLCGSFAQAAGLRWLHRKV